jgi:hypothetical protein
VPTRRVTSPLNTFLPSCTGNGEFGTQTLGFNLSSLLVALKPITNILSAIQTTFELNLAFDLVLFEIPFGFGDYSNSSIFR